MEKPVTTGRIATDRAVAFAMVFPSILTWFYFVALAGKSEANHVQQLAYAVGKTIQFGFPIVFMLLVAPGQLRPGRPRFDGLAYGLIFGLLVIAAMFGLYYGWMRDTATFAKAAGQLRKKLDEFGVDSPGGFLMLAAFVVVGHSLLEEYYWRWFVFGRMRGLMPQLAAIVVSSLGFMAHHVIVLDHYFPGRFWSATMPYSCGVAIGGMAWAWLYARTGSIWSPWLSHLIIDGAIFWIGWDLLGAKPN